MKASPDPGARFAAQFQRTVRNLEDAWLKERAALRARIQAGNLFIKTVKAMKPRDLAGLRRAVRIINKKKV